MMVENENYSFETLFENKEEQVLTCYKAIIQNIETYAEPIIEVKKTTLHIIKKRAFLGVHPMKKWLDLNIVSDHPLSYSKLMKSEQISKNRYHNKVRLYSVEEIDKQLLDLIKDAYQM